MRLLPLLPVLLLAACGGRDQTASAPTPAAPAAVPALAIPRLPTLAIDGDDADWAGAGLRVSAFAEDAPRPLDPALLTAGLRVGWTDEGLAVLVDLASPGPWIEDAQARTAFQHDSIELFLRQGSQWKQLVQPVISLGMDPTQAEPRVFVWDYRGPGYEGLATAATVARQRTTGGCRIEALVPWAQLRLQPSAGLEVEFRCNINKDIAGAGRRQLLWRTRDGGEFQRLVLATQAGPAIASAGWILPDDRGQVAACAVAPAARAGAHLALLQDGVELAGARLASGSGRASASISIPAPAPGKPLLLTLDGEAISGAKAPDVAAAALRDLERAVASAGRWRGGDTTRLDRIRPTVPAILIPGPLPQPLCADAQAARLAGIAGLAVRWFDAARKPVQEAREPGRYGALITIRLADGRELVLAQTAFLPAAPLKPAEAAAATMRAYGADPAAEPQTTQALERLGGRIADTVNANRESAVVLAAQREASADGQPARPAARDAAWWHAVRREQGLPVTYPYAKRLPDGYAEAADRRWPAIIYLHGSGGEVPRDYGDPAKRVVEVQDRDLLGWAKGHPQPFAIYALLAEGGWRPDDVAATLDRILAEDRIDPDRVIIMGFSMGGMGTWDCTVDLPGRWAAAVPIGGRGGRSAEMSRAVQVPAWVFNGDADGTTTLADAQVAVDALRAAGGDVRLTVLPGIDHGGSQNATFATPGLWEWLAERRRAR
jgi:predicted esterase